MHFPFVHLIRHILSDRISELEEKKSNVVVSTQTTITPETREDSGKDKVITECLSHVNYISTHKLATNGFNNHTSALTSGMHVIVW